MSKKILIIKILQVITCIILIGFIIFFIYHLKLYDRKEKLIEKSIEKYITETKITTKEETSKVNNIERYNYVAILEIPIINLRNGLVSPNNKYNSVEYNIEILNKSEFPTIPKSNLILAAHNGNSEVSFFKNLSKVTISSPIYIYYNGYKYIYSIEDSYEILKTGEAIINRDSRRNTITLITCKDNSDTKQLVFIGYLIGKEIY